MSFDIVDGKIIPHIPGQKTCNICNRSRPHSYFAKTGRYHKPYCKPCYKAYQSQRGKVDRMENRSLTIVEFRDYWLPLMIEAGEAPWADPEYKTTEELVKETAPTLSEQEKTARHNAIAAELNRTVPS